LTEFFRKYAKSDDSLSPFQKKCLKTFAKGLESIPIALAQNAGRNSQEIHRLLEVYRSQDSPKPLGIDLKNFVLRGHLELGVLDGYRPKVQGTFFIYFSIFSYLTKLSI